MQIIYTIIFKRYFNVTYFLCDELMNDDFALFLMYLQSYKCSYRIWKGSVNRKIMMGTSKKPLLITQVNEL